MEQSRMNALRAMLEQDPGNSFVRYGLAMAFVNSGSYDQAVEEFRTLLQRDPDYVAAYYHGGQALEKAGNVNDARAMYEQGVIACGRTGDAHTRSEIEAALAIL